MLGFDRVCTARLFSLASAAAVAAAALPRVWAVIAYPIDKGSVYAGPITAFTGLSLGLWVLLTIEAFGLAAWIHFRRPEMRRPSWFALLAGEAFYIAMLFVTGAVIDYGLNGTTSADVLSTIILAGAVVACVWGIRETLRAPSGDPRRS